MKKVYYYLFYKFYKFSEAAPSRWLSDWKASFSLDVLSYFFISSLVIYYKIFFNHNLHLSESNYDVIIVVGIVSLTNYFIFHHKDQWKEIVSEFDKLPKKKNRIGSWVVFLFVIAVIANLIFAFYQMSLIDWSLYR